MILRFLVFMGVLFCGVGVAQEVSPLEEAARYLQALENTKEMSLEEQVEAWQEFLRANPESPFRVEIERNLESLENLLRETDPSRKKEARDTDLYLRAVEFSKTLTPQDQIRLWRQFLDENPQSLYRKEAESTLRSLEAQHGKLLDTSNQKPSKDSSTAALSISPDLQFKDPNLAYILATFPGLIIPGLGHWYTKDYAIASVLTALRLGGGAILIPGYRDSNSSLLILGYIVAGASYLIDVADSGSSAKRYNLQLEREFEEKKRGHISALIPESPKVELLFSFAF